MKILVLMKRFSTNKDLVMQNFGRQVRLFEHIKKFGHDVDFFCMDFKKFESKKIRNKNINYYIEPFSPAKFNFFLKRLDMLLKNNKYDIIVASTSPLLGIMGYFYSKKYKIKVIYELQDSFDIYDEYKIPFVKHLDRFVTKKADIVICVSNTLMKRIKKFRSKPTYVIENGIERNLFRPIKKETARKKMHLPLKARIIVHVGLLARIKGYDIMIDSFKNIMKRYPDTFLLLSGEIYKHDKSINLKQKNIIFRKFPKREDVVLGINASDVAILPNPKNAFTEYSFPYKAVEYMACNVPIVATRIGDVAMLLKKYKGSLCEPNAEDMSKKIMDKLEKNKRVDYSRDVKRFDWKILAEKLNNILASVNN